MRARARPRRSTPSWPCWPRPAAASTWSTGASSSATTTVAGDELAADVNRTAHHAGIVLVELSPIRTSLEDRYLALVQDTDHGGARHDPHRPGRAAATAAAPHHRHRGRRQRRVRRRRHARRVRGGQARAARRPLVAAPPSPSSPRPAAAPQAFAVGASFVGFFVFVTFIALVATEFSGGTFRALLLRDPHRLRLIVGKLVGALVVAAGALVVDRGAVVRAVAGRSPRRRTSTPAPGSRSPASAMPSATSAPSSPASSAGPCSARRWPSSSGRLRWRSAVGFAWAGPFENIIVDSWTTGYRVFPGQVLAAIIQGGTPEISLSRAVVTGVVYVGIAAAATTDPAAPEGT